MAELNCLQNNNLQRSSRSSEYAIGGGGNAAVSESMPGSKNRATREWRSGPQAVYSERPEGMWCPMFPGQPNNGVCVSGRKNPCILWIVISPSTIPDGRNTLHRNNLQSLLASPARAYDFQTNGASNPILLPECHLCREYHLKGAGSSLL